MTIDIAQGRRALNEIRRAIQAAENAGDPTYIVSLVAEDAVLMVPDFPVQEGRAACSAFISGLLPGLLDAFDRRVAYASAEVRVLRECAIDRGTFVFTARPRNGGATDRVTGKYLWIYEQDSAGTWKCSRMIMSRDEDADRSEPDPRPKSTRLSSRLALGVLFAVSVIGVVGCWVSRTGSTRPGRGALPAGGRGRGQLEP